MLYIVSTPIGNLKDITYRAVEVLQSCDYILAEDTRESKKLLSHYQIEKKLISFHEFSSKKKEDAIIEDLHEGKNIALISDAGTPLISDPGSPLVQRILQENLPITAIPGPSAFILAAVLSGFDTTIFQFVGFLAKKEKELTETLKNYLEYPGTTIAYESPHRILKTVKILADIEPEREIAIFRELTKKFEEHLRGTAQKLFTKLENTTLKGEIVLVISKRKNESKKILKDELIPEFIRYLKDYPHLTKDEVIAKIAHKFKVKKEEVSAFFS